MKLNAYNHPGVAYGLPRPDAKKTLAEPSVNDLKPQDGLVKPEGGDEETDTPATQETILEGIQRVKQAMDELRYNRAMTVGDKELQLKPLQAELDELVTEMQLAIKDFATSRANELFGLNSIGSDKKLGTLFDFIA